MLRSDGPSDLDILIIYNERTDVDALRNMGFWEPTIPAVDIIAMTPDDEHHYQFITVTGALRLQACSPSPLPSVLD